MKIGRFRVPRDPVVAYGALIKYSRPEAKLDAAQINDFSKQVTLLQRRLKALQKSAEHSTQS